MEMEKLNIRPGYSLVHKRKHSPYESPWKDVLNHRFSSYPDELSEKKEKNPTYSMNIDIPDQYSEILGIKDGDKVKFSIDPKENTNPKCIKLKIEKGVGFEKPNTTTTRKPFKQKKGKEYWK
jgi:hypothetical protein